MQKITKVTFEGDFKSITRFLVAELLSMQKYEVKTYPTEPHTLYVVRESEGQNAS